MKKLLFLILILPSFCLADLSEWFGVDISTLSEIGETPTNDLSEWVGQGIGSAPAGDYTDVIIHLNADGTASFPTYTLTGTETGPATGTIGSLADATTAAKLIGDYGFEFPSTSDLITFSVDIDPGLFVYAFRFELLTSWSASGADIFDIRNVGNVRYAKVEPYYDGDTNELRLSYREDGGTAQQINTANANLAADTKYICVVEVNESTDLIKISVYNESYSLLDSAVYGSSFTAPTTNYDSLIISSEGISAGVYIDNIMISDLSNPRNFITDTISDPTPVRLIDRNDTPN